MDILFVYSFRVKRVLALSPLVRTPPEWEQLNLFDRCGPPATLSASHPFMTDSKPRFPEFSGDRDFHAFRVWSTTVLAMLQGEGIDEHLTADAPDAQVQDADAIKKKRAGTYSRLLQACKGDAQRIVLDHATNLDPKSAFEGLKVEFAQLTAGQTMALKQRLYAFAWTEAHSLNSFKSDLHSILQQLQAAGHNEPIGSIKTVVSSSLPVEFDAALLKTSDSTAVTFTAWFGELSSALAQIGYDPNHVLALPPKSPRQAAPLVPTKALAAVIAPHPPSSGQRNGHSNGHGKGGGKGKSDKGSSSPRFCFVCGDPSHMSYHCSQRKTSPVSPPNKNASSCNGSKHPSSHDLTHNHALSATPPSHPPHHLILDSGATVNIVRDSSLLQPSSSSPPPPQVHTANGTSLKLSATGTMSISLGTSAGRRVDLALTSHASPSAPFNLLSLAKVLQALPSGAEYVQTSTSARLKLPDNSTIPLHVAANGLVSLSSASLSLSPAPALSAISSSTTESPTDSSKQESSPASLTLLHRRLGHFHLKGLTAQLQGADIPFVADLSTCEDCLATKSQRPRRNKAAIDWDMRDGHVIQMDILTLADNTRYPIAFLFVESTTRLVAVYPAASKSLAPSILERFVLEQRTLPRGGMQTENAILRTDQEAVLASPAFVAALAKVGMKKESTSSYSQHRNGLAERHIALIKACALSMRHTFHIPPSYAHYAIQHAATIHNYKTSAALGTSPYEKCTGSPPPLHRLRVFGCRAYVHVDKARRTDKNTTTRIGSFVGLSPNSPGFLILVDGRIHTTDHVRFEENVAGPIGSQSSTPPPSSPSELAQSSQPAPAAAAVDPPVNIAPPAPPAQDPPPQQQQPGDLLPPAAVPPIAAHDAHPSPPASPAQSSPPASPAQSSTPVSPAQSSPPASPAQSSPPASPVQSSPPSSPSPPPSPDSPSPLPIRRSNRLQTKQETHVSPFDPNVIYVGKHHSLAAVDSSGLDLATETPRGYSEACQHEQWMDSMEREISTMENMGCFQVVPRKSLPPETQVIPVRYVYRVKRDTNGNIDKLKSRLVARGDLQKEHADIDTYSPTGAIAVARMLLSLAARKGMHVTSFDVSSAFLTAPTAEANPPVIKPPPNRPSHNDKGEELAYICRRAIYGLRDSPARFHQHMASTLRDLGLEQSKWEPCLFTKQYSNSDFLALFVHVDDVLVISPSPAETKALTDRVSSVFNITMQDPVTSFLNIRVLRTDTNTIKLDQSHTIASILERSGMADARPVHAPLELGVLRTPSPRLNADATEKYQQVVGAILYLQCTRPDIAAATSILCQFNQKPCESHQKGLAHLLRYLKHTQHHQLVLGQQDNDSLNALADSDWGGDLNGTGRSRTGFVIYLHGPISWRSTMQKPVSTSTAEAELYALTDATQELLFLQGVLSDDLGQKLNPPLLRGDNQGAISIASQGKFTRATRHIDIKHRFIHHLTIDKRLRIKYIPTQDNTADILTKILPTPRTTTLTRQLLSPSGEDG